MKIYVLGEKAARQPSFTMSVSPAADDLFRRRHPGEVPADWVDDKNAPQQFNVEFLFGEADVSDDLARYMLDAGLAKKTRLILPNLEDARPYTQADLFGSLG